MNLVLPLTYAIKGPSCSAQYKATAGVNSDDAVHQKHASCTGPMNSPSRKHTMSIVFGNLVALSTVPTIWDRKV